MSNRALRISRRPVSGSRNSRGAGLTHNCCFMVDMRSCDENNWLGVLFLLFHLGLLELSSRRVRSDEE
jgi:hypothetical protein